jgi:hypothetical protein
METELSIVETELSIVETRREVGVENLLEGNERLRVERLGGCFLMGREVMLVALTWRGRTELTLKR